MNISSQTKRRLVHGGNAFAVILIAIGIIIALNFLTSRYNERIDLTQNKLFSVSEQSKTILKNLQQSVDIQVFVPDSFRSYEESKGAEFIKDLLAEYDNLSGNVQVEFLNPNKEPNKAKEAGIQFAPAVVVKTNGLSEILYGTNANEQSITATIVKMTREESYKIGIIGNKGGRELGKDLNGVKTYLEGEGYLVEEVLLASSPDLSSYRAILITGPEEKFSDSEKYLLDKYIYEGGSALFALDPLTDTGLNDIAEHYGVSFNNDFVIEEQSYLWDLFRGRFNHWPIIIDFTDFQVVRNFSSVLLPLSRSLSLTAGVSGNTSYVEFMKTTPNSWAESDITSGQAKFDQEQDRRGPLAVGIAYVGKVKSFFEGKDLGEITEIKEDNSGLEMTSIESENQASTFTLGENKETRLIFLGDSDFMSDEQIRNNNNGDLILNSVNWLTEDTDLISIRPKDAEDRRIKSLDEFGQNFVFWINILGTSLVVLLFGLIRYLIIKKSRNSI